MARRQLTGDRAEQQAYFQLLRRLKEITATQYQRELKKLEKAEERFQEKEIVARQLQAETRRLIALEEKRMEEREAKLSKTLNVRDFITFNNQGMTRIRDWIQKSRGGSDFTVVAQIKEDRKAKWETIITSGFRSTGRFSAWWENFTKQLRSDDDSKATKFSKIDEEFETRIPYYGARLILLPFKEAKAAKLERQYFRHGQEHCVFAPLSKYWKSASERVCEKKKKLYLLFAKRCEEYAQQYDAGISAEQLAEVLPKIGITMEYCDVLGKVVERINQSNHTDGGNTCIQYVNSMSNHLDVMMHNKPKEISIDEMREVFRNVKHCAFRWGVKMPCPTWLRSTDTEYKVVDKSDEILERFAEDIKLKHMKFDGIGNKKLFDFIHHAIEGSTLNIVQQYSGTVDELDKEKAYANFWTNTYYSKFQLPAALHHFVDLDLDGKEAYDFISSRSGFFAGRVYNLPQIAKKIARMEEGGQYVLYSPVWCWLMEQGANVFIGAGTWGSVTDWRFSQDMIEGKMKRGGSKGVPYYSLFVGRMMSCMKTSQTMVKTDLAMLQNLRASGYKVRHSTKQENGLWLGEIEEDKHAAYTAIHVGAAIVQYTMLDSLMEASKYDLDDVIGVNLDAVLLKCKGSNSGAFRVKSIKHEVFETNDTGLFAECDINVFDVKGNAQRFEQDTFLRGPGGAGKTHSIMNPESGYVSPCYVTLAHRQCVSNHVKYNCKAVSLHNLLGINGDYKKTQSFESRFSYVPGVIFADEATMWDIPYFVSEMKNLYPYALILVAGHYDEHWRPYQTSEFNYMRKNPCVGFDVFDYRGDYRSKCDKLKQMKIDVEAFMSAHYNQTPELLRWLINTYSDRVIRKEDVVQKMQQGDWILCSTRTAEDSQINTWTNTINEQRPDISPKHYVANHTLSDVLSRSCGGKAYLKGDILDFPIHGRTETRHAYTIHAVQGETITTNIFIDMKKMFDFAQAYTAISRATHYDHVFFVM